MKARTINIVAAAMLGLAVGPAVAQHRHGDGQQQHQHQPYAGMQERQVKALSPQQIEDLKSGRGMGLALAAELNGYPGPLHVLELGGKLALTGEQTQQTQRLYEAMKAEAIAAGDALIAAEHALDRAFAQSAITPESLAVLTARIGEAQGRLRAVHLKYHLSTRALLTAAQRERYAELRGYR